VQIKDKKPAHCKIPMWLFRFMTMKFFYSVVMCFCLMSMLACKKAVSADHINTNLEAHMFTHSVQSIEKPAALPANFNRDSIVKILTNKTATQAMRIIHVMVPLCDNDHQGIVAVNKDLGNGLSLRTNLYWGAGYGIKTHFVRSKTWNLLQTKLDPTEHVLERVVFKHNSQNVILIADAYRGDRMKACLMDYFNVLTGTYKDSILLGDYILKLGTATDLVVFNGHDGLMDTEIDTVWNTDGKIKDAVVIACTSHRYFKTYLNAAGGYPLVTTSNLLAPEAYVLHGVLEAWIANRAPEQIRLAAAQEYNRVQNCGIRGASNLFVTGW
jgi:hypothetical protein